MTERLPGSPERHRDEDQKSRHRGALRCGHLPDPRHPPGRQLETDTLILIGDADDWTPAARCAAGAMRFRQTGTCCS